MVLYEQAYQEIADSLHEYVKQAKDNTKAEMLIVRIGTTTDQSALTLKVYIKEEGRELPKRIGRLCSQLSCATLIVILKEEGFELGRLGGYYKYFNQ